MGKPGRPISEDKKQKRVTIRISDEMHKRLTEYASEHNMTLSAVVLQATEKEISGSGK